ncbi:MFS transporter [Oerskovia turbata]
MSRTGDSSARKDVGPRAPGPSGIFDRRLVGGVYVPTFVFEAGVSAIVPVIALSAISMGAGIALAGFVVALLGLGQIAGDVPAGAFAARFGDRRAMMTAAAASIVGLVACALAPNLWVLGAGVFCVGMTNAVFMLARQAYLTEVTPVLKRARALSTLAGTHRIGAFVGPFAAAAVLAVWDLPAVYWLAVGTSLAAGLVTALVPDVAAGATAHRRSVAPVSFRTVLAANWRVFATLGIAVVMVGATRAARQVVLPLWSEHLGFSPATTSIIFGLSGAIDMLLFYPAGKVMDRLGRLWVAIPCMVVLGGAIVVLPLTSTVAGVAVVAMVMGFGNGIGSGILMTLGADVAPPDVRAQFLGIWRLFQDSGSALGPLVVSAGAALGSLAGGIVASGTVGLLGAVALARWVPRWSVHANRTTRRRAGIEQ